MCYSYIQKAYPKDEQRKIHALHQTLYIPFHFHISESNTLYLCCILEIFNAPYLHNICSQWKKLLDKCADVAYYFLSLKYTYT